MTLLPSSTEGLMGLWEEQPLSSFSFKGLELGNESSPLKWEWFSEPLDCPPNERCNPESMVGALALQGGGKSVGRAYWQNERQASPLPGLGGKGSRVYYRLNIFFNFNVNS